MLSIKKLIESITKNFDFTPVVKTWSQIATPQAAWYVVASVSLKPKSQYLIVANNGNGQGGSVTCNVNFDISGTPVVYTPFASATNDGAGNYTIGIAYVKTGNSGCTLNIRTYGYNSSVTNINGSAIIVPLVVGGVLHSSIFKAFSHLHKNWRWCKC